jgi:hypothetical protein
VAAFERESSLILRPIPFSSEFRDPRDATQNESQSASGCRVLPPESSRRYVAFELRRELINLPIDGLSESALEPSAAAAKRDGRHSREVPTADIPTMPNASGESKPAFPRSGSLSDAAWFPAAGRHGPR